MATKEIIYDTAELAKAGNALEAASAWREVSNSIDADGKITLTFDDTATVVTAEFTEFKTALTNLGSDKELSLADIKALLRSIHGV